jgi:metal-responsive CopG/Arc/MetJ family transcriptional regulator
MKIVIDLMEDLMDPVQAEAERLGWDRSQVINSAVLRYFSEPFPSFDEEAAQITRKLDEDLRQGLEEIARKLGLSREQVIGEILGAYFADDREAKLVLKVGRLDRT